MNAMIRIFCWIIWAGFAGSALHAADDFNWESITDDDWADVGDSTISKSGAVMLFEKIVSDDRKMQNEKCTLTVYRRIRIFGEQGRVWGDAIIPNLHRKQRVPVILGRTILRDGTTVNLAPTQVFEKKVLQTKGLKIKQKSFSLPAISNDCIAEYYFEIDLPVPIAFWEMQKEIELRSGQFVWKFYRGSGLGEFRTLISSHFTPNFTVVNYGQQLEPEYRPSIKNPEEAVFNVQDLKAFETEPNTLPDVALKAQLYCYYGDAGNPASYWGSISGNINEWIGTFTQDNSRVRKLIEQLKKSSDQDLIASAYRWIDLNIHNIDYDDDIENYKNNVKINDVVRNLYGTSEDINLLFYDMLRELNINAKMVYTVDRDEKHFNDQVKVFQFDHSLVAVEVGQNDFNFYDPGDGFLPCQRIAWYSEGTKGMLVGDMNRQFININSSKPNQNQVMRYQNLVLHADLNMDGKVTVKNQGHAAHIIRHNLSSTTKTEQLDYIKNNLLELYPDTQIDSTSVNGLEELTENVVIEAHRVIPSSAIQMGNHILLKPMTFIAEQENPFSGAERKYPIIFDYAQELTEIVRIILPPEWQVEALPEPITFSNKVGLCQITFESFEQSNLLNVQYRFILNSPFWKAESYADVRSLFEYRQTLEDQIVSLKRIEPDTQ